jgi:hypothetical protein
MPTYTNGRIPLDVVSVILADGHDSKGRYYQQRLTPQTTARWRYAQAYSVAKWGKKPLVRSGGPNSYRPIAFQQAYYQDGVDQGNPLQAAYPGTSSHGGWWKDWRDRKVKDCLAIDVDPQGLTWAQVWEACRAAGFECGLITPAVAGGLDEPWHVIDFNAFGPMPAFAGATPLNPSLFEEDDMTPDQDRALAEIWRNQARIMQILEAVDVRTGNTVTGNLAIAAERIAKLPAAVEAIPASVWGHPLRHTLNDLVFPAGDFLRYEPAEHENTRRSIAAVGKATAPDFDYEKVAAEIAAKFPQLDAHAFAVAAADEADRREREALAAREAQPGS